MTNQDEKKIDDDEFIQNLDTSFPLSGGENDEDLENDEDEDNDKDENDDEDDEEFKENLETEFPLSGGETE